MISTNSIQFSILLSTVYRETLRSLQYKKEHLLTHTVKQNTHFKRSTIQLFSKIKRGKSSLRGIRKGFLEAKVFVLAPEDGIMGRQAF